MRDKINDMIGRLDCFSEEREVNRNIELREAEPKKDVAAYQVSSEDLSTIETAILTGHHHGLRSGDSRTLQGHSSHLLGTQSLESLSEKASQQKKKTGSATLRRRLDDVSQQLAVYSNRSSVTSQEITTTQTTLLNSPHSIDRLADERLQKAGLQIQYMKDDEQEQSIENLQNISAQQRADETPVSDADDRATDEPFKEVQFELMDKSEKGAPHYFVIDVNGSDDLPLKEHVRLAKKQRKPCAFKTRFSDYTKNVLEHAYEFNAEGSSGRKHLEPNIVKKLSDKCGISHEQVKQWVRNKNKKVRRRYHMLETALEMRDNDNYQFSKMREEGLRPSFTLNQ